MRAAVVVTVNKRKVVVRWLRKAKEKVAAARSADHSTIRSTPRQHGRGIRK